MNLVRSQYVSTLVIIDMQVNMEKVQERWWEAVYVNEPHINVRKIDPSRPMTDLDDEAQSKIEEMMYNERQKRMGLPQSHEKVLTVNYVNYVKKSTNCNERTSWKCIGVEYFPYLRNMCTSLGAFGLLFTVTCFITHCCIMFIESSQYAGESLGCWRVTF